MHFFITNFAVGIYFITNFAACIYLITNFTAGIYFITTFAEVDFAEYALSPAKLTVKV